MGTLAPDSATSKRRPSIVDQCLNLFGTLKGDVRARLLAVLENPTQETWDGAYSIIINGAMMTLWQAWVAIDTTAPRRKATDDSWPRIPDQFTLYRAIRHATSKTRNAK